MSSQTQNGRICWICFHFVTDSHRLRNVHVSTMSTAFNSYIRITSSISPLAPPVLYATPHQGLARHRSQPKTAWCGTAWHSFPQRGRSCYVSLWSSQAAERPLKETTQWRSRTIFKKLQPSTKKAAILVVSSRAVGAVGSGLVGSRGALSGHWQVLRDTSGRKLKAFLWCWNFQLYAENVETVYSFMRKCINESWNAARLLVLWHFDLKCIGRIWRMEHLRIVVQFSSLNMILKDIHRHFAGITVVSDLVVHLLQFNAATAWCADFCHQVVVAQHAQDMCCSLQPSPLHQYCDDITIGFCNDIL